MTILTLVGKLRTSLTSKGGKKSQEGQGLIVPNIEMSEVYVSLMFSCALIVFLK